MHSTCTMPSILACVLTIHEALGENSLMAVSSSDFFQKYCWPWRLLVAPFFSCLGSPAQNTYQSEALHRSVLTQHTCQPVPLEQAQLNAAARIQLCLPEWSQNSCCWKSSLFSDSLKLAYRQLLSLFTAFTLVQLRSLLRSKCWQAIFINHVRLNVFKCMYLRKNNHALVLFLFSSGPWFLAFCFP